MTAETVLVTGAFGLVGSETVRQLMVDGRHVIATDLDVPANRKAADQMPSTQVRWADLTDPDAVAELLREVSPSAIIHLAAIIPPVCYARPALARRVNVDATRYLVDAAAALPAPPRFVQASSVAVYGARNPHRISDVLTADTPLRPSNIYGAHKVDAEKLVRASGLDWVVLRLGGVLTAEPRFDLDLDTIYFEASLPIDGRIQTVDVRDVAHAFVAATTAPVIGETLLIGGDESTGWSRAIAPSMAAAMGLVGGIPAGRKGNPNIDNDGSVRLDGHHAIGGSPEFPTSFVAAAAGRDRRANGLAPLPGAARRPADPCAAQTPLAVFPLPRPLRRPVGRDRGEME